jgi:hypothetical protein
LLITLGIAVVGGAATGFLMTCLPFPKEEFTDKVYFAVPDDFTGTIFQSRKKHGQKAMTRCA